MFSIVISFKPFYVLLNDDLHSSDKKKLIIKKVKGYSNSNNYNSNYNKVKKKIKKN